MANLGSDAARVSLAGRVSLLRKSVRAPRNKFPIRSASAGFSICMEVVKTEGYILAAHDLVTFAGILCALPR